MSDLTDLPNRLRCRYASGPLIDGVPEFGYRDTSCTMEVKLPTPIMREAADTIDRLTAERDALREQLTLAEAVRAAQVAGVTEGLENVQRDAARYVYLRDVAWHSGSLIFYAERYGPEDWDAHIDAARAALKGEAG
jgi:hypothetical protein